VSSLAQALVASSKRTYFRRHIRVARARERQRLPDGGAVDEFDLDGRLVERVAPWARSPTLGLCARATQLRPLRRAPVGAKLAAAGQ